jgi:hypothetical protein
MELKVMTSHFEMCVALLESLAVEHATWLVLFKDLWYQHRTLSKKVFSYPQLT